MNYANKNLSWFTIWDILYLIIYFHDPKGCAVSFNKKCRQHGKLFQSRCKSILCQEDIYLKELVRVYWDVSAEG